MKLNDNTIDYNSIPNSKPTYTASVAGKIFDAKNKFWELEGGDEPAKLVNAVEIDWNGAVLPNSSTTIGKQITNRIGEIIRWN